MIIVLLLEGSNPLPSINTITAILLRVKDSAPSFVMLPDVNAHLGEDAASNGARDCLCQQSFKPVDLDGLLLDRLHLFSCCYQVRLTGFLETFEEFGVSC